MNNSYDTIIVGGGHAGCEAAAASARIGARTLLITHSLSKLGEMSCNPAIGGLGKGHLVREIDALDGIMGRVADAAGIHFRVLNRSRGSAVQGPRAQADRALYRSAMQNILLNTPNLEFLEAAVADIIIDAAGEARGCITEDGAQFNAGAVVITTGTFLNGLIHLGTETTPAGRVGDKPSHHLAETLRRLGFPMGRLKTGTPPRLDGTTIDWESLEQQHGDDPPQPFSALTTSITNTQIPCYITTTTPETHAIISTNIQRAPLYSGQIKGTGPRYCPSIEDKVVRFAERSHHQVFLEPEGLNDTTIYPNGISTSLPLDVQKLLIASMPGLGHARIIRPGYAIEYDFCDPRDLLRNLETKRIPRLFFAGQINGTTGYEEAAAQGMIAGLNAALRASGAEPFMLTRTESYIGVMIDDLILRGTNEPYRMFTSRAEYRLSLRADNADQRLTPRGIAINCVSATRAELFNENLESLSSARAILEECTLTPNELALKGFAVNYDGKRRSAADLLSRHDVTWEQIVRAWPALDTISQKARDILQTELRYAGYLTRQEADIKAFARDENLILPEAIDIDSIGSLSNEIRQKLRAARPSSLGAASRIPGMTPAALVALLRHVRKK